MLAGQAQSRAPDDALLQTLNPEARALIGVKKTRRCYVSARDIARFAQAIGADDPVHYDAQYARGTPHGGIVAPALFCQSLSYEELPPRLLPADGSPQELNVPIQAQRTVGGGSAYQIFRLVRPEETLTITTQLTDIQVKQGKSGTLYLLSLQTDFVDSEGKPVASELATYIKRN